MNAIMQQNKLLDGNAPKLLLNSDVAEMISDAIKVMKYYGYQIYTFLVVLNMHILKANFKILLHVI